MNRASALLGSALFLLAAPGVVAGLIPYWITGWRMGEPPFGLSFLPMIGAVLAALGGVALVECFVRFAWNGRGTPAPVAPTQRLVLNGFYRHVRNPMYVAVSALNIGQALLFSSSALLGYAALTWIAFHTFVLLYEEPTLSARYGAEYDAYLKAVPRWMPRLTPWRGD